ncbi:NAD(P)H-hydrate dehydratase [Marinobacter sp. SS21]|uniref:NAD(P)H-hydrate dehydratase n=1 Tax=Marinobacter sp. SS21 TaxID=2979460 RepID=UPI0023315972|nr:NAD(P)H-hydrate dehydratase [Marinobacter sp. SS21]MDC0661686.1 NAD(P)H-hydrate dehydratase [Marinobacter sp. SS21]
MIMSGANSLPESLYVADVVRTMDRYLIDGGQVPGFELMQRAASATFRQLVRLWPQPGLVLVVCGAGNNGGDGYLVAAAAKRHGLEVCCLAMTAPERLQGDAGQAWQAAVNDGVAIHRLEALTEAELTGLVSRAELIVDAMLGTGARGVPREQFAAMIARCNSAAAPVLAVDVPSGLDASTGAVAGVAIQAAATVTFIGLKVGLFTGQGPACAGSVLFDALVDAAQLDGFSGEPAARRVDWSSAQWQLPLRSACAHKGRFGHLLIVAGDRGFGGAGLLAAEAAVRAGAGLVTLATRPEHVAPALARCPSVMVHGVTHGSELAPLIRNATTLVCGPGLGQSAWGQQMLQQVLACGQPKVLDADALNLLAQRVPVRADNHILTPHPGEAARLLDLTVAEVEADRLAAASALHNKYGGVIVLKGAGTVVAGSAGLAIVQGANPGMATGGMGDVLSGIIGALLAQLGAAEQATELGATLHLASANRASDLVGYMGLSPGDVIDRLPSLLRDAEVALGQAVRGVK